MIKTIELTKDRFARLSDREPFLMPDKLELDFNSIGYDLTNAFINLKNGEISERYKVERPFIVPEHFLFAGNLYVSIDAYLEGTLVKHWDVMPIKIIETTGEVYCFEFLSDIEKRLANIEATIVSKDEFNELKAHINTAIESHNELAETVSEIKETYVAESENLI